ncbi:hypothetical protein SO694_00008175 [Aureococcus anophagefferens]|uniref:Uncharacterized protein n=1 Tax=Aureococcus anophagefferens TaxID=44056 RepID=A0ABR1GE57_AURAN
MAHLGLGSPSPVAPASPGRYLAGSPQTFASAVPESGAVAVEDDKRYRRSIHALEAERSLEITRSQLATELKGSRDGARERRCSGSARPTALSHRSLRAEVEEARVEIARLRDALRAATAEAADARGERARRSTRRPRSSANLADAQKAASDAKHECARLRSACRSAQSDAERCVKVAEAAAEAATKREEENKREFLRQKASPRRRRSSRPSAASTRRSPSSSTTTAATPTRPWPSARSRTRRRCSAALEHEQILAAAKRVSEDRVKALTAELEGDRDRYAATLAKTTAMVDQRIEEAEADARRLTLRCETAERSLSDATARSDGANAARLKAETVARAREAPEEAEAELSAAKLRSAEAESTGAALGDQRHRDASRIAELEQKLENFAPAVQRVAELAKKAAEQKLRAAHEGSAATEASTVAATRRAEDAEARSEKIMEQRGAALAKA